MMSQGEKLCVICGESCAGLPRIKNERGQYAHKACVESKQKEQALREEDAIGLEEDGMYDDALGGGMDDLLGDLEEQSAYEGTTAACPGCGQRMNEGTVVCMGCGYNTQSGKSLSTKSKEAGAGTAAGAAALGGIAKVGGFAAGPILPVVGAVIGGLIGASVWAAVSYFLNIEFGWIAIGVGALCGLGARLGGGAQTTGGGVIAGAMAAVVSIGAIAGGKYAVAHIYVQDSFVSSMGISDVRDVDDEWALHRMAFLRSSEQIDAGEVFDWGGDQVYVESAFWPEDFPRDVQDETNALWDSMNNGRKVEFKEKILVDSDPDYALDFEDIDDEWALSVLAENICEDRIAQGVAIEWVDVNMPLGRRGGWPNGFPDSVRSSVQSEWDAMSSDEINEFKMTMVADIDEVGEEYMNEGTMEVFIASFKHPLDLVFLFFAVVTAYGIGANED